MKILYLTIDRTNMVVSHFENWQQALSNTFDIDFIIKPITGYKTGKWCKLTFSKKIPYEEVVLNYIKNTDKQYDWIVTDADFGFCYEKWDQIKIPKAMIIEDAWGANVKLQMNHAVENKWDIVFYKTKEAFFSQQKKYLDKLDCRWLPHSINLDMFKDYKLEKKRDCIMVGAINGEFYKTRYSAFKLLEDEDYFERIPRPSEDGYGNKGWPVDYEYAELLNESKICITCGGMYNAVLMKHLEILASKSLLMSNYYSDLEVLGFENNKNMIVMDLDNLKNQVKQILNDDDFRNKITKNGYNFIRENHSCEVRAKQLKEELSG